MPVPKLLPTSLRAETFGGVTYHVEGELVPVLQIELGATPVYFEHHVLLWKEPAVDIDVRMRGALKRVFSGMPIFLTIARGPGRIGFSRDLPGQVFPIHLKNGESIQVREHQWLAATDNVRYSFAWTKGFRNILFGGNGFFIDTFTAEGDGIVWLHGAGNVFGLQLAAGEQIDIEPGGWVFREPSVDMQTVVKKFKTGVFASSQLFWNRFTGPGVVTLQSMYLFPSGSGGGGNGGGGFVGGAAAGSAGSAASEAGGDYSVTDSSSSDSGSSSSDSGSSSSDS